MSRLGANPIGYVAADVEGQTAEQVVALVTAAGYAAVDWTMEQFDPLDQPPEELVRIAGLARAAGLAIPQLMVHQDYVTPDPAEWERRVRRSERAVEAAAAAEIASIGVVTGPNRWTAGWTPVGGPGGMATAEAWGLARGALERVLARGAACGVTVALEPCWGTLVHDRASADRALAALDASALGLTLDPSHFVLSGDDLGAIVEAWRARLTHVHLKDAFGRAGTEGEDFLFLLPGEGAVDWPALLGALERVGYAGAMSVEFESFRLRERVLGGDVARGAVLARNFVTGLLGG